MNSPLWFSIPQLASCRSKVERAAENIKNFQSELDVFQVEPYEIVSDQEPNTRVHVYRIRGQSVAESRFSILAGEIVYHLRSSLDHLAHSLVLSAGNTPTRNTAFPVFSVPPRCRAKPNILTVYERHVQGITPNAQAIIESLQPYKAGRGIDHPLLIINKMNITDKHHALNITLTNVWMRAITFNDGLGTFIGPAPEPITAVDGAELIRIIPILGEMNVKPHFSFQVQFAEVGSLKNQPVIPTLAQLLDFTVDVISKFGSEF